jgi:hypothetical protein
MHKTELVQRLRQFAANFDHGLGRDGPVRWKGQLAFARFLVHYLDKLSIPHDEKYDFWRIEDHLPRLMVEAFEELRTGTDPDTVKFRKDYEVETEHEVPNITDIGATDSLHRGSAVQTTLGFMLREVTGQDWVENKIDKYCNAQAVVLQQTFDKFLLKVYRRGMGEMIDKGSDRGMSGVFGTTHLRTYVLAGRVMFTFARKLDENKPSTYEKDGSIYSNEDNVSFVGEDGDPLCLSAGIQSIHADFRTCLDMIEDVIKGWPADPQEQRNVWQGDKEVAVA